MGLKALLLFLAMFIASYVSATRELAAAPLGGDDLVARIKADGGGLVECWNALYELKSCTNEIVAFLMNGQANIGPDCCKAIKVVTESCWPAMLTSLGFTAEEGNLLIGYCDGPRSGASGPALSPLAG